jgi:hypothetical protein
MQDLGPLFNHDADLFPGFLDVDAYGSSLPDILKQFTPSFDHLFTNYSSSIQTPS